jgi:hypothetical protein
MQLISHSIITRDLKAYHLLHLYLVLPQLLLKDSRILFYPIVDIPQLFFCLINLPLQFVNLVGCSILLGVLLNYRELLGCMGEKHLFGLYVGHMLDIVHVLLLWGDEDVYG